MYFPSNIHFVAAAMSTGLGTGLTPNKFYGLIIGETARRKRSPEAGIDVSTDRFSSGVSPSFLVPGVT